MNKKILIIITGTIGIILVTSILVFAKGQYSMDTTTCKNTETGWQCEFGDEKATQKYENQCKDEGGRWKCFGLCLPQYIHYCDFPFSDAGQECSDSKQCNGTCITTKEYVETNYPNRKEFEDITCSGTCKGTCTTYPLRSCEWWFEVNNNTIEDHTGIFCD